MTPLETHEFLITEEDIEFKRLDLFLKKHLPDLSRSYIKDLFEKNHISCDSVKINLKKLPPLGSKIIVKIPEPEKSELIAQDIDLEILYEDEFLLFIDKPSGMVVHPAPGNWNNTLVNALLFHCKDLKGIGNVERPGIVHRLDKGTSGVMVVAKEQKTHAALVNLFKEHDLSREYVALTYGKLHPKKETIETFIKRDPRNRQKMSSLVKNGKSAITHYQVLKEFEKSSLVSLKLETGRTHQIRVHLSQQKRTPILNDHTYGNPKNHIKSLSGIGDILGDYAHPLLHAKSLSLVHPMTGKELVFQSDPPPMFQKVTNFLEQ